MDPIAATILWLGKTFGADAIKSGAKFAWDASCWTAAAASYTEKIERDYGKLPLFGKDVHVPITDIYTYVHVLDQQDAYHQFAEERLPELYVERRLHYDPDKRQDVWRMVADNENLFILGDPGAGKTTFLKMATIKAARGQLRSQDKLPARIPIFVSLREHARANPKRTLYASVKHELEVCGFPDADLMMDYLLNSGRVLLLWDGLDEVKTDDDQRANLVAEMHDFVRKYGQCQYVISCRIAAADYSFGARDLRYVKVAPFSDKQIKRYLANWPWEKAALADECFEELQLEKHKGLQELARTPILLTLLAIAYEQTLTFPARRIDIYYQAIDALLCKWDADRGIRRGNEVYAGLELGYKWDLMTEVSAEAFYNGEFLLTRREWGERIRAYLRALPEFSSGVDGGEVLDAMASRHGLFVQQTPRLYSLAHLSFQEYFTARDIKENIQHGSLDRLLKHIGDDQWREVFLLVSSSLRRKDATTFFNLFIDRLERIAVRSEPNQRILKWAHQRAKSAPLSLRNTHRSYAMRWWYYVLAFDRGLSLTDALDQTAQIDQRLALTIKLDRMLKIDLAATLDSNLMPNEPGVRAVERIRSHARFGSYARNFHAAKVLCKQLGFASLHDELDSLAMPTWPISYEKWDEFRREMASIIQDFGNLSNFSQVWQRKGWEIAYIDGNAWDGDQLEIRRAYMEGTILLLDCLKLATVGDRRAIEERLLLPVA